MVVYWVANRIQTINAIQRWLVGFTIRTYIHSIPRCSLRILAGLNHPRRATLITPRKKLQPFIANWSIAQHLLWIGFSPSSSLSQGSHLFHRNFSSSIRELQSWYMHRTQWGVFLNSRFFPLLIENNHSSSRVLQAVVAARRNIQSLAHNTTGTYPNFPFRFSKLPKTQHTPHSWKWPEYATERIDFSQ